MSVATKTTAFGLVGIGVVTALLAATVPANAAGTDTVLRPGDINFSAAFSPTKTMGHNVFLRDGLKVWTDADPAGSQGKAAGYWAPIATETALSDYSAGVSMEWIGTDAEPGLQIVFDADNISDNGNDYNVLVGESVYGGNWWLTNGSSAQAKAADPSGTENGGNGSDYFGTLSQWATALPDAQVKALGYSLGTFGANQRGEGVLRSVTTPDTTYVFTSDAATQVVALDGTVTATTPAPRALKLVFRADTLGENEVAASKLRWRVLVDGKKAFWSAQNSGDVDRFKVRFAKNTGTHKVEVKKSGVVVETFTVKTGRPA